MHQANKKLRQEEKEKERLGDLEYMKNYAQMLEKQEAARSQQMENLKAIQVALCFILQGFECFNALN